jgi:hypothetical protein
VVFSILYYAKKVLSSEFLNIFSEKKPFQPNFLDFEKCKVQFSTRKKQKNLCFDNNSPPRGHELFIHICFKIVTKKSREE